MIQKPVLPGLLVLAVLWAPMLAADQPAPSGLGGAESDRFRPGPAEAAARYASGDWQMLWQDEFADGSAPSPAKWSYEEGLVRNRELQFYTVDRRDNARMEGGELVITARREDWKGARYTSASLSTRGRFSFTYGKVEIRARIPTGRGTWPALWFLGDNIDRVGWPKCGEIDLMENVGFDPERIHCTIHTGAFNHRLHTQRGHAISVDHPWADFHRYGLLWSHERIEFFFDGEKVSEFANDGQGPEHWPFDSPQYLIINLALGGAWGGEKGVDDGIFPVEYRVDYVRVWQQPKR